jgi:hypothetical protein
MEISSGFDRQSPKDRFGNGFVYPSSVIRGLAALICCRIVRNSKPREPFRYVLGFVFGASFNACAQTPPPDTPFDAMTRTATLEQKPSTTLRMGTLRVQLEQTTLENHLWRGASEADATMRMGAPSYQNGPWRSFDFAGKVAGNCPGGGFDLTAALMLHFQNGRVNSLWVSQITSC